MTKGKKASALVFLCVVWGLNWVAIKISLETITPFTSAAVRFFLASVLLLFYMKWKKISLALKPGEFKYVFISAFLMYPIDYGLLYWGEQFLSAGVTSIFFSTFAIFTAVFSTFVYKNEAFSWRKFTGLIVGLCGIVFIFYDQLVRTEFDTMVMLGALAVIISAVAAALATVIVKKHLARTDPVSLTFHQMSQGALFLLVIALFLEDVHPGGFTLKATIAVVYMALLASAATFVIYYQLLKEMTATSLSFIIYVIPVVAIIFDFFIYGQMLSLRAIIGMVIIFLGIWLSQRK